MTTFYLSSEMEQSVWMLCLFFSLILDVFLFLASPDRGGSRRCRLLNAGVFIALLILLCIAGDAFDKKADGLPINPLLPFPMWSLWCIYKCTACSTYWRKAISSTSMNCGRHLQSVIRKAVL